MTLTSLDNSSARNIEAAAVEWLLARDEAQEWSNEKQVAFDEWLAKSPAHVTAFWRVEASWVRTDLVADARPFGASLRLQPKRKSWLSALRLAAAVAVLSIIGAATFSYLNQPGEQTFATAVGERKVVTLFDGSKIELNTNTVVQIGLGEDQRHVKLVQGEAYFQVYHDTVHPFTVVAAGQRVTDLGTEFSVQIRTNGLKVALIKGRASIEADSDRRRQPIVLKPGDVAIADAESTIVRRQPQSRLQENLAWRKGILVFDDTTLSDAVSQFNRYNGRKIVLEGTDGSRFRLNGTIRVNDREEFVRLAKNLFGLHVKERGSETVIVR